MIINVPLDHIDDNPYQRRQDYGDVPGLAADIQHRGLLQIPRGRLLFDGQPQSPMQTIRNLEMNGPGFPAGAAFRVELAFGHRRVRAYRVLAEQNGGHWTAMPVYIEALDDDQMLDFVWSENQNRFDIDGITQAQLLAEKLERARAAGGSQATVAAEWGLDRSTIANKLRLLELPADVQTAVRERRLSERQALALLPVVELEMKLNGNGAQWADRVNPWNPVAPATYVTYVIANPNTTSDKIRDYVQQVAQHAGRPLGDAFAVYDAGEGPVILQPACKGCPKRHNQTCLHPPCHDARRKRYQAAIPEWATRETGLPFSDNPDDFPIEYHSARELATLFQAGHHDELVVGVRDGYCHARPFPIQGASESASLEDWKHALIIGRKPHPTDQETADNAHARPAESRLKLWRKTQEKADRERAKRAKAALRSFASGLLENETGLRVLAAMMHTYELSQYQQKGQTPTAEQLLDLLFEKGWRNADTVGHSYNLDQSNRTALRNLLHAAAISPDIVDPPDPALRLFDIGQLALLTYDATRLHVGHDETYKRLRRLRDALAEFEAAPHTVAGSEELEELARYLRAALEVEEAKLPKEA